MYWQGLFYPEVCCKFLLIQFPQKMWIFQSSKTATESFFSSKHTLFLCKNWKISHKSKYTFHCHIRTTLTGFYSLNITFDLNITFCYIFQMTWRMDHPCPEVRPCRPLAVLNSLERLPMSLTTIDWPRQRIKPRKLLRYFYWKKDFVGSVNKFNMESCFSYSWPECQKSSTSVEIKIRISISIN